MPRGFLSLTPLCSALSSSMRPAITGSTPPPPELMRAIERDSALALFPRLKG